MIELDRAGWPVAMADVLLGPQYPNGVVVGAVDRPGALPLAGRRVGRQRRPGHVGRESVPIDFSTEKYGKLGKVIDEIVADRLVSPPTIVGSAGSVVLRRPSRPTPTSPRRGP